MIGVWDAGTARSAIAADALDGHQPQFVLEPTSVEMLAAMLEWSNREGMSLVIRGGGTKLPWAAAARPFDGILSTARLNADIEHHAGDLTAAIGCGVPLSKANDALRRHGQWLPLDPPFDATTIGGLVAANDSGPRRHRYGTPRDLIIGVEIALADGRRAKGGGRVVKNVAGYDLPRLMCGSFGTLGVIVNATFKLAPVAESSQTVIVEPADRTRLAALVAAFAMSPLTPSTLELEFPGRRLLIRFETVPESVKQQVAAALSVCREHGSAASVIEGAEEDALWNAHQRSASAASGTVVRIGVLPAECGYALAAVDALTRDGQIGIAVHGRAALGVLRVHLTGTVDARVAAITHLRTRLEERRGHVVIETAEPQVRAAIDSWGRKPAGLAIMRALKQCFDPRGTCNAGRGPVGL